MLKKSKPVLMRYFAALFLAATLLAGQTLPILFTGNRVLSERELYGAIGLELPYFFEFWKASPKVDPTKVVNLVASLKDYCRYKGFYDARIIQSRKDDTVIIHVQENAPVTVADLSTINVPPKAAGKITLRKGERFDASEFAASKKALKVYYDEQGFCNATMTPRAWVDKELKQAYIVFDVDPGKRCRFGPVTIEPPDTVDSKIIRSFLRFKEGEPYSLEKIRQSYTLLYANEGLMHASIDTSGRKADTVPVGVRADTYTQPVELKTGAGYSSDEGLALMLGAKHRNLLGNLRSLNFEARYTQIKKSAGLYFGMPLANRNRFESSVVFTNETFDGYKERRVSETLQMIQHDYPLTFKEKLFFDQIRTYESSDPEAFPPGPLFLTSPIFSIGYDTRDKLLEPSEGHFLGSEFSGSLYSFLSDATYYKIILRAGKIWSIPLGIVALKVEGGAIEELEGRLPPSYRFYGGGMNSNRAYQYRQLGPKNRYGDPTGFNSYNQLTLEYRFEISGPLRGVLFNDTTFIGTEESPNYQKVYTAVGPGIRYQTPIGPLAIDLGVDPQDTTRYALHFHIGELF